MFKHGCIILLGFALAFSGAVAKTGYPPSLLGGDEARQALEFEAEGLTDFILSVNEPVRAVIVELHGTPGFTARGDKRARVEANLASQDAFLNEAGRSGLQLLPRLALREQPNGLQARIPYRFTWLMNGLVAYVPESQLEALRQRPEVADVHEVEETRLFLDFSVDYILGDQPDLALRRLEVYGDTEELRPAGAPGHPEAPALTPVDGYEGQGMILSIIDSGLDFFHPGFGGGGPLNTPLPQLAPLMDPSSDDNKKIVYFYNLGGATTLDDHGHGTHVAHTAAGYLVDGDTPPTPGYGLFAGPTPGGVPLHGVAPQARLMGYPVCAASGNCPGDVPMGIEDSASPFVLIGQGDGGAIVTDVPKPVADVINMSLGGGSDPASATSRVSNNGVLAGLAIAAAAGNDGPGAATVGAPCVGALVMCVASALDPGSTAGTDVLASMSLPDLCAGQSGCALPPPPADTGAASVGNPPAAGERQGMKSFYVSGGGAIPDGSVSAHYVHVDRDQTTVPAQVTGRIALLTGGTGTFFQIVNPVATLEPAAILLITDTQSATAVAVINGVPTFTFPVDDGNYLLGLMGANNGHGDVSPDPVRVSAGVSVEAFEGEVSSFSSRGPNAHDNARYRYIKPDIAAPGSGILAATTAVGNPNAGVGMASLDGYTVASGTSMASPHAAGALILARQRLRDLGFDSTDLDDPDYLDKRFEASILARALLQNNATNLRTGPGQAEGDGAESSATINDIGSGLTNIDAALQAEAVLLANERLYSASPREFTIPDEGQLPVPVEDGSILVPLPTLSFGLLGVVGSAGILVFEREIMLRTLTAGGAGDYSLEAVSNRNGDLSGVSLSFHDIGSGAEITSVAAGAAETVEIILRLTVESDAPLVSGLEMMWYISATQTGSGQRIRMPVYARADQAELPELAAPVMQAADGIEAPDPECGLDTDGLFTLNWTYDPPAGSPEPEGWRIQRSTLIEGLFFDAADEALVAGSNSTWSGSEQWISLANPETDNLAYFIPNLIEQNEALVMIEPVSLPAGYGATLSFVTNQQTEEGFDFAHVEVSADGGPWVQLGRFSGTFMGTREFDLTPFSGQDVRVRFRLASDLLIFDVGWWVEQIRIDTADWTQLMDVDSGQARSADVEMDLPGPAFYRVAGIFPADDGAAFIGPYAAPPVCVNVDMETETGDVIFRDRFQVP